MLLLWLLFCFFLLFLSFFFSDTKEEKGKKDSVLEPYIMNRPARALWRAETIV